MNPLPDFGLLLRPVREAAQTMPREALPTLVGELARLQAEILLPIAASPPPAPDEGDRQLAPKEVAAILNRSRHWCYANRHRLPITLDRLTGRWSVSEKRLRRWLDARTARRS